MRIVGTLNVRTKCGFKPLATQMRCTAARLTPAALAMVRVLQCVASAGFSWVVFSGCLAQSCQGWQVPAWPRRVSFNAWQTLFSKATAHNETVFFIVLNWRDVLIHQALGSQEHDSGAKQQAGFRASPARATQQNLAILFCQRDGTSYFHRLHSPVKNEPRQASTSIVV
jgi:hypothetical protein